MPVRWRGGVGEREMLELSMTALRVRNGSAATSNHVEIHSIHDQEADGRKCPHPRQSVQARTAPVSAFKKAAERQHGGVPVSLDKSHSLIHERREGKRGGKKSLRASAPTQPVGGPAGYP